MENLCPNGHVMNIDLCPRDNLAAVSEEIEAVEQVEEVVEKPKKKTKKSK